MALDFPNSPTNGQTYTANNITWEYETSSTTWKVKQDSTVGKTRVASVTDVKGNTVPGGPITANTWTTRDLNTISDPSSIGISVSTNVITIPAGTYKITWRCPSWRIYTYQTKLEYSTDSTFATGVSKVIGSSEFSSSTDNNNVSSTSSEGIAPSVTFAETTYVRIRQWAGVTGPSYSGGSNGLGVASYNDVALTYSGESSVYTMVQIEDLATAIKDNATYVEGNSRVAILKDEKDEGVDGGSLTTGGWKDRNLTVEEDPDNFVDFTAGGPTSTAGTENQPGYWSLGAGTYLIEWSAPGHSCKLYQTLLVYSTTQSHISTAGLDGSASYALGTSEDAKETSDVQTRSFGSKVITIPAGTTYWFKIVQRCSVSAFAQGLGVPSSHGVKEIYTQVRIEDLATAVKDNATYVEGTSKIATVKDVKAHNENGGEFTPNTWIHRNLNTLSDPNNIGLSISGNVVTVPAGTYSIRWRAPAYHCDRWTSRLAYSSTSSTVASGVTYITGESSLSDSSNNGFSYSEGVIASLTFSTTTYIKIEQWSDTGYTVGGSNSTGLGVCSNIDGSESGAGGSAIDSVYTTLEIEDLATAVKNEQTVSIIKQIQHANGPATQQSYNDTSSWTTIVEKNITLSASNNVLVNVKAGFYGGDEGEVFNSGRLIRTTSSSDTNLWEYASVWGRAGTLKASFDGPSVVDTPGTGTHTYKWQTKRNTSQGSNDVLVPANGNSITLTEYT